MNPVNILVLFLLSWLYLIFLSCSFQFIHACPLALLAVIFVYYHYYSLLLYRKAYSGFRSYIFCTALWHIHTHSPLFFPLVSHVIPSFLRKATVVCPVSSFLMAVAVSPPPPQRTDQSRAVLWLLGYRGTRSISEKFLYHELPHCMAFTYGSFKVISFGTFLESLFSTCLGFDEDEWACISFVVDLWLLNLCIDP